ncbi:MAG TPA: hypothetical protein VGS41_04820 [Chthonomonadales bacterium]|nr:hypothetical protein [Chthonomonadales bacterium]
MRQNVDRIAHVYRKYWDAGDPPSSDPADPIDDVPIAFQRIYEQRRSPDALAALLDLQADGSVEEAKEVAVVALLRQDPVRVLAAAGVLPGRLHGLADRLAWIVVTAGGEDSAVVKRALAVASASNNKHARRAARWCLRLIHRG